MTYVCGFIRGRTSKDFLVLCYNRFGNLQWQRKYDNVTYHGDDVATDILVDDYFVYVMGYTYNGLSTRNDMMMVVYDKSGNFSSRSIYEKKGNEYPTGFILSEVSRSPWVKSRTTSTGFSDNVINHGTRDFLTITFNNDLNSNVLWAKTYDNINDNDVPTAVTSYRKGNTSSVYVTGYTRNTSSLYDFVTIRYDQKTGNEDWVKFFDYPSSTPGNDRASSLLVYNDSLVVSGSCSSSPNGFATIKYALNGNNPPGIESWSKTYMPSFLAERNPDQYSAVSILHEGGNGNITAFFMGWNETFRDYAAQMYDANGNVIYTLDPDEENSIHFRNTNKGAKEKRKADLQSVYELKQNYPNPFNPETKISYNLPEAGDVSLKIYDIRGKEITSLIESFQESGSHSVNWNAADYSSGVYYYRLIVGGNEVDTRRMILLR